MATPIDTLDAEVSKVLSSNEDKFSALDREKLLNAMDTNKQSLLAFVNFLDGIVQMNDRIKTNVFMVKNPDAKKEPGYWAYMQVLRQLIGTAKNMESKQFLSAFRLTALSYCNIMDQFNKNIDQLIDEKALTIFNSKLSHIAVLGVVQDCNMLGRWLVTFAGALAFDICKATPAPAPYVLQFLQGNLNDVISIINRTVNSGDPLYQVKTITDLAKSGNDVLLVGNDNMSNVKLAKGGLGKLSETLLESGVKGIFGFRWWNNIKVNILDRWYRRKRQEREYLQAQVDLMKLTLDGMDKNSPEYVRLAKLIANYEAIFAKMDRDLDNYYGTGK